MPEFNFIKFIALTFVKLSKIKEQLFIIYILYIYKIK